MPPFRESHVVLVVAKELPKRSENFRLQKAGKIVDVIFGVCIRHGFQVFSLQHKQAASHSARGGPKKVIAQHAHSHSHPQTDEFVQRSIGSRHMYERDQYHLYLGSPGLVRGLRSFPAQ
jgi:hypothetical protein